MKRFLTALALSAVCGSWAAVADTVTFKDGSTADGVVVQPNADTVMIQVGTGKMTFAMVDVASIEKNDKKGDPATFKSTVTKRHQDALQQRTGLDRSQRDLVRDQLALMRSDDEGVRNAARRKLVQMGNEMDVFKFLNASLPYTQGPVVAEMMQALYEMNPDGAKDTAVQQSQSVVPANRAKALQLLANYKKPEDIDTVVRGMVDPSQDVRIATAHALGSTGEKRATPLLLKGLASNDPMWQNACRSALKEIWGTDGVPSELKSADEWKAFWSSKAGSVKDPYNDAKLNPLVTEEDLEYTTSDHNE